MKKLFFLSPFVISYKQAIDEGDNGDKYSLEIMSTVTRELHKKGLCFGLNEGLLKTKFYWTFFCQIDLLEILPLRTVSLFRPLGVQTIGDLVLQKEITLVGIRGFGSTSMAEVVSLLNAFGLKLDMSDQDFRSLYY